MLLKLKRIREKEGENVDRKLNLEKLKRERQSLIIRDFSFQCIRVCERERVSHSSGTFKGHIHSPILMISSISAHLIH